jgi:putative ABC transport system permease protein
VSLFLLARRHLRARLISTLLTVASVTIGVTLFVAIFHLSSGVKSGLLRMSSVYELVIGAKGSPTQLVLSTVFFLDVPTGNIPYTLYLRLKKDSRVDRVVALNGGDSYRGFRIIGTTRDYFARPPAEGMKEFRLTGSGGRLFERDFEAVIGAEVARQIGFKLGDTFVGIHGATADPAVSEPDPAHAKEQYTVVGILDRTNTPADRAIFTTLETVWDIHGLTEKARKAAGEAWVSAAEVTALLVKPRDFMGALFLHTQTNRGQEAQAVFPPQVIARLLETFGAGETILKAISLVVIVIASLAIMISMMETTVERQREIATMRALGAQPRTIFLLVLIQAAVVAAAGAVGGLLAGRGLATAAGMLLEKATGIPPSFVPLHPMEFVALIATVALGVLAAMIPGVMAYRTDIAINLYPVR